MAEAKPLRLKAQDEDDLAVISAALQDAVGQLGDFAFDAKTRSFTLLLNRYRWEAARPSKRGERVRTAVQAGSVLAAKSRNLKKGAPDAVVSLLAMSFEPGETAPGGQIIFTFSGDGELRLSVECIDMVMADVSRPWRARVQPGHRFEEEGG